MLKLSAIIILIEFDLFRICQGSDVYLTEIMQRTCPCLVFSKYFGVLH